VAHLPLYCVIDVELIPMLQLSVDLREKSVTSVEREVIFKEVAGHNKPRSRSTALAHAIEKEPD
jgi:hypothetical protein